MKQYKPGQLITIQRKVYRIVKGKFGCRECKYKSLLGTQEPCRTCMGIWTNMTTYLLKRIR